MGSSASTENRYCISQTERSTSSNLSDLREFTFQTEENEIPISNDFNRFTIVRKNKRRQLIYYPPSSEATSVIDESERENFGNEESL